MVDLSVVMTVHNGQNHLPRQLLALANQSARINWEIVIVNNRSVDDTLRVIDCFSSICPVNLSVIDGHERLGISYGRNLGVRNSRGHFLAFCDSDDVVESHWVQEAANALINYPIATGVCRVLTSPIHAMSPALATARLPKSLGTSVSGANFAVRKRDYISLGGFNETLPPYGYDDAEFSIRAALNGYRIHVANKMLVYYRIPESQLQSVLKIYKNALAEVYAWDAHRAAFSELLGFTPYLAEIRRLLQELITVNHKSRLSILARQAIRVGGHGLAQYRVWKRNTTPVSLQ